MAAERMTSMLSRGKLREVSLAEGGFDAAQRRQAWLYLFDLQHLSGPLEASTSQSSNSARASPNASLASSSNPLLEGSTSIPLDEEGWQIAHPDYLDGDEGATQGLAWEEEDRSDGPDDDDDEEEDDDGWNVASSKRKRRRRRGKKGNGTGGRYERVGMTRSTSKAETLDSVATGYTAATTATSDTTAGTSREQSLSRLNGDMDREEARKEKRRQKKKEKKRKRKKGAASAAGVNGVRSDDDEEKHANSIDASAVLLPTSTSVEVERNESITKDWVQADEQSQANGVDAATATSNGANVPHKDEAQVALDINRSFIHIKDRRIQKIRREQLSSVVNGVLRRHPSLNYFQGYHDIISVLLLVLIPQAEDNRNLQEALQIVIQLASRVSLHFCRDSMAVNMEPTMGHLKIMRNLLREADYPTSVEVEAASPIPYFALPWVISLFSHDLELSLTLPVFDYLFSRDPSTILYLCVALIIYSKDDSSESDAAEKHHSLSQLPERITSETIHSILKQADSLQAIYSLESIGKGKIMGPRSVLSTWSQLPTSATGERVEEETGGTSPWEQADALAEAILRNSKEGIVLDVMPTPPASDTGHDDSVQKEKKGRKKVPKKGAPVIAFVGAVGAVGVAALLMYSANRLGITL